MSANAFGDFDLDWYKHDAQHPCRAMVRRRSIVRRAFIVSHHATVFAYFRTRSELVTEVLREVARYYSDMADRHYKPENPAARALLDFALAFASSVESHADVATELPDWSTAVRSEIWPLFLEFHRNMVERIEDTIRRGQREGTIAAALDANNAALIIVGSAHLVLQMKFSRTSPEKVHRFLLALLRAAIGPAALAAAIA